MVMLFRIKCLTFEMTQNSEINKLIEIMNYRMSVVINNVKSKCIQRIIISFFITLCCQSKE